MRFFKDYSPFKNLIGKNSEEIITNKNTLWLIIDKVYMMALGVFVTAIVARYFGPEQFGIFNYALSFATLFTVFSALGLETLTVKAIVDKEADEGTILFTSFILRLIGGLIIPMIALPIIIVLEPNDRTLHIMVAILSLGMIFKSLEVIEYWIQAYQKAKISSIIRMITFSIISVSKLSLVFLEGSIEHYTIINAFNIFIVGLSFLVTYIFYSKNRTVKKSRLRFDGTYAKSILMKSRYLIFSGFMVTIYMQIDKVMLGALLENRAELGIYSAAVALASMWYFIPMAIITSYKPVIMRKKKSMKQNI